MKKSIVLPILIVSFFLFSGCIEGKGLFLQSVKNTAPQGEEVGPSFAPVNVNYVDSYGNVLFTRQDRALYTYSKDSIGVSKCDGSCAVSWPPFLVDFEQDVGGNYDVISRSDGKLQVTLNGMPLYTYTPDSPNRVTGDGKSGDWDVVVVE